MFAAVSYRNDLLTCSKRQNKDTYQSKWMLVKGLEDAAVLGVNFGC